MQRVTSKGLLVVILLLIASCATGAPIFDWHPAIWATDSKLQVVVRSGIKTPTSDPAFDEMVCIHKSEPRKALEACQKVINACQTWKKP